jgi:hypothetical protein
MTARIMIVAIAICVSRSVAAASATSHEPPTTNQHQDPRMTNTERAELVELLLRSEKEFLEAVEELSDQQWSFKPGPDRWSVAEVAEHIVLADTSLFDTARQSLTGPQDPEWPSTAGKTEILEKALPNRSRKVDAPGPLRPQRLLTRAHIMARFKEERARTLAFVRGTDAPVKAYTAKNPFFGVLNAYQWLLYIPLHHVRHNQQIAEVKASPGFPQQ